MSFLKNKHVVVALIVTPILAVLGYFAVDAVVSEKPHAAVAGQKYQLAALPSCRYNSGKCVLKNGDFKVQLFPRWLDDGTLELRLQSEFALQQAVLGLVSGPDRLSTPQPMKPDGETGKLWVIELTHPDVEGSQLHVAMAANDSWYFGETGLTFTHYETSFGQDFRRE